SNTGELLSLLDAAAPGPGGKVTILATGATSSARVNGTLRADRGTIDIRHTGDAGQINLGGPGASDAIDADGDVIEDAGPGNSGGFGGNGSRNGTFGGAGANNPLPLNQAPPLDGPGG